MEANQTIWPWEEEVWIGQFCTTPPNILSGGILVGWPFKNSILVGSIPTVSIPNPDQPPLVIFLNQFIFSTKKETGWSSLRYLKNSDKSESVVGWQIKNKDTKMSGMEGIEPNSRRSLWAPMQCMETDILLTSTGFVLILFWLCTDFVLNSTDFLLTSNDFLLTSCWLILTFYWILLNFYWLLRSTAFQRCLSCEGGFIWSNLGQNMDFLNNNKNCPKQFSEGHKSESSDSGGGWDTKF